MQVADMSNSSGNFSNLTASRGFAHINDEGYIIAYSILCSLVSVATVIGNLLLFFTILKTPLLRTPTNSLLLSLATADLVAGAVMIPLYVQQFINNASGSNINGKTLCLVRKFLFLLTSGASITSLAVVSVDRMIALSYPFIYARKMNAKVVAIIIVTVWAVCLTLTSSAVFFLVDHWESIIMNCGPGIPRTSYLLVTPTLFYLPGVMILLSYIKIFTIARKHRRKITSQSEPSIQPIPINEVEVTKMSEKTNFTETRDRKSTVSSMTSKLSSVRIKRITRIRTNLSSDLKAAKTVSILVGLFLICWCPVAFFYIYLNTTQTDVTSNPKYAYIHDAFMLLSFLNTAVDPILYTFLNKEMKSSMKRHLRTLLRLSR